MPRNQPTPEAASTETEGAAPAGETKLAKFERLGKVRMTKLLHAFKQVENLSSPNYERTDKHRDAIFAAIDKAAAELKAAYQPGAIAATDGFDFGADAPASTEETAPEDKEEIAA